VHGPSLSNINTNPSSNNTNNVNGSPSPSSFSIPEQKICHKLTQHYALIHILDLKKHLHLVLVSLQANLAGLGALVNFEGLFISSHLPSFPPPVHPSILLSVLLLQEIAKASSLTI
jgi:hypothetical protein